MVIIIIKAIHKILINKRVNDTQNVTSRRRMCHSPRILMGIMGNAHLFICSDPHPYVS